jgi:hypothetical protein
VSHYPYPGPPGRRRGGARGLLIGAILTGCLLLAGLQYLGAAAEWRGRGCDPDTARFMPLFHGRPGPWQYCRTRPTPGT